VTTAKDPQPGHVPYTDRHVPDGTPEAAAKAFHDVMRKRRSVRMFSDRPVSLETIEWVVRTATWAPNGANKQPWRFVCVRDPAIKRQIRAAAEKEEREFYSRRAPQSWLDDLEPLGTDENKEFLEVAPWLIVVFKLMKADDGSKLYYINESVGLAAGFLLAAAHHAGLATLTHTPSPMGFLNEVLERPSATERPMLLIPVGYPADDCEVPIKATTRRPLEDVMVVK